MRRAAARERAADVIGCVVHPDTNEAVKPFFLRMSCIVPANMMMDLGMITARGTVATVAAQTLNQAYNASHYWANRNCTNSEPPIRAIASFAMAGLSSVGAALWFQGRAAAMTGARAVVMRRASPFLAVASADVLNLGIMRSNEWVRGIAVRAGDGTELGSSRRAGAMAVASCIAARILAAGPVLLSSSFALEGMDRTAALRAGGRFAALRIPLTLGVLGTAIVCSVPLAFAFFQRDASVAVPWLEDEFQGRTDAAGLPVTTAWYHKGL